MGTNRDGLPPRNSHNPKNISPPSHCLWSQEVSAYSHKTRILTHKLACSLNEVVLWGHVTNYIHHISTCERPKNTILGKVLTYSERIPYLKSHSQSVFFRTRGKRRKREKYLKMSEKMYKIWKHFEREQLQVCVYCTHETARICPAWPFDYVTNARSRGNFKNIHYQKSYGQ